MFEGTISKDNLAVKPEEIKGTFKTYPKKMFTKLEYPANCKKKEFHL
jgi:hypothetical protein